MGDERKESVGLSKLEEKMLSKLESDWRKLKKTSYTIISFTFLMLILGAAVEYKYFEGKYNTKMEDINNLVKSEESRIEGLKERVAFLENDAPPQQINDSQSVSQLGTVQTITFDVKINTVYFVYGNCDCTNDVYFVLSANINGQRRDFPQVMIPPNKTFDVRFRDAISPDFAPNQLYQIDFSTDGFSPYNQQARNAVFSLNDIPCTETNVALLYGTSGESIGTVFVGYTLSLLDNRH